jgi:hypothetical protein
VFPRERRERTPDAAKADSAVPLDLRHGPKLVVQHLAGDRHPIRHAAHGPPPSGQFSRESPAGLPKQRFELICGQSIGKHGDEVREQRDVGTRQQLLDLGCELEDMGGARGTRSLPRPTHRPVTFHCNDLGANGASGKAQLAGDLVSGQATTSEEGDNAPAAGVEDLLFQHWLRQRSRDTRLSSGLAEPATAVLSGDAAGMHTIAQGAAPSAVPGIAYPAA